MEIRAIKNWRSLAFGLAFFVFALPSLSLEAQEEGNEEGSEPTPVSFFQEVRPILQARCHGCHQPAKVEGEYIMTDFDRMIAGGGSGDPAIVPGKPEESYLCDLIAPVDGIAEMPPNRDALEPHEIELIERWILEGATNDTPTNATTQIDMEHPPVYEAAPVITSLDFSHDGRWLAVSGYHEVLVYDASTFELSKRLVGLSERIESAVFSPDSKRLAVAGGSPGRRGELQIWDVENSELLISVNEGYDTLYGASWSGDGKLVAFGCPDTTVRAIESETGEEVLFNGAHNDWVLDTVFSKESDHLVTVSRDRSMKLYKVDTQRFIDNITSITPGALKGGLNSVTRHPNADQMLTGGADGVPKLYKMIREQARKIGDDFNLIRAYPAMSGRVYSVRFSIDGSKIVAGSSFNGQGQIRVYQTDDAKQLTNIDVAEGGIYAVDFAQDGASIAAAGFDGLVRIYQVETGELQQTISPLGLNADTENE